METEQIKAPNFEYKSGPSFQLWKENIVEVATVISDRELQRQAWIERRTTEVLCESAGELICMLWDDSIVEDKTYFSRLSPDEQKTAKLLISRMDGFATDRDSAEIFSDPGWEEIRQAAKALVNAFAANAMIEQNLISN